MKLAWILSGCLCGAVITAAHAAAPKHKNLSPEQTKAIQLHQRLQSQKPRLRVSPVPARPFSEVEEAGYFFISEETDFDSANAKRTMLQHLPSTVTAVIFGDGWSSKEQILERYKDVIPAERVKVITLDSGGNGFWARDGLPVPVWSQTPGEMNLVDAVYYHGFEPDAELAKMFAVPLIQTGYNFEGGNFMTNDRGDCLTVDNDLSSDIPDRVFVEQYGCKRTIRLPFESGIGHVDERVRFIRTNLVVTDSGTYAETLRSHGFEVVMLPRPNRRYETYVNALLVNDTIYVPVYNQSTDREAISTFESFGLKVVPIETLRLSNGGQGSLHCITMTYPKVPFQALLSALGAREL